MYDGKFRGRLAMLLGTCLLAAAAAVAAAGPASPFMGGWRNLHSANGADPALRDVPFAVLPAAVAKGARFSILDREAGRTVCCLVVESERLDAIALETRYRLPGVWIADLTGGEEYNRRRGEPHIYEMKREGDLVDHVYSDDPAAYSDMGGLLLPADASMDATGVLTLGADRYRLQFKSLPFADENGALDRYTLQPASAAPAVVVEVPFSTY
ncbi:decarboxylase [Stenotrophomonas sp.]|uniref:decarboxylase n=1 Tax=Stenotrophomonas sp. TaxID=69392 RepID=UPI00289CC1FD|nr:decarboxylase [Stenotrophomonas sp.]